MFKFNPTLFDNYFQQAQELFHKLQTKSYCLSLADDKKIASQFNQVLTLLEKSNKNLNDLSINSAEFAKLRSDMIIAKKIISKKAKKQPLLT